MDSEHYLSSMWASLIAQLVKNPPAVWETWVWSLGWEDPLEKRKATHSSILAWRIPWTVAYQAPPFMGFSRQEYWSGLPFPSPEEEEKAEEPEIKLPTSVGSQKKQENSKKSFLLLRAAAAKSLHLCLTLCDPTDGSPSGSSIPGILQARTLEWVAISFSNACIHVKLLQTCLTVRPYGQQPNRLLCPQDSPGKNTGVSCFIDYNKALDCVDHNKLWKILKEMGIPNHLTCLLRNLFTGQEATVITGCGTTNWFKIGKGVCQGCILSPWLFNLCAEYIMWNDRLDKSQAGIKTAGRNIKNLRYADDITLMAESEKELKSLLMRVKEESKKRWLKTQHSKI